MAITWNDLFMTGSIVDLACSRWTARLKITAADLGVRAEDIDAVDKALALGSHRLMPQEAFEAINAAHGKALRKVRYFSLPFGFVSGARYVPEKNLKPLSEALRECKTEFDAAVRALIDNYDAVKTEMLPSIQAALVAAAKTEAAAAAAFERVQAEYPSSQQVAARFNLAWNVYAIQGPRRAGASAALESEGATVRGAVQDMIVALRAEVVELIRKGGKLQERSIASARTMLDHVDAVNVLGDVVLTKQVAVLRDMLNRLEAGAKPTEETIGGIESIKAMLTEDIEAATKAAEQRLAGAGWRKLSPAKASKAA